MTGAAEGPASLEGCSALVTGASRGIGRATARELARAGARVFLLSRSRKALEELAGEIGGTVVVADVAEEGSVVRATDALQEELEGPPEVVVNAAGVFSLSPFAETDPAEVERNLEVNLTGTFRVIRQLLPGMLRRGDGRIVNVGSVAGRKPLPGNAAYSASKYGLRGMHEVLLEELRGTGVRATLLEPAATDTSIWDRMDPDADPDLPDRRAMLSPERVAEAVLFVATRPPEVQIPLLQIERA